jgi:GTP:adenosylcobinamide-phosphate guanylyltransferase
VSVAGVVLAGRRNEGRLRAEPGEYEAQIPVAGRPMGAWVVAALQPVCDRVVVVGPEGLGARALPPGPSLPDNLRRGVEAVQPAEEILVATGDAPLVTAEALAAFLAASRAAGAALGYPVVPRSACEAAFPGTRRTYVRADGAEYTGGNCFYLRAEVVAPLLGQLEAFYRARKNPLRLAGLFGPRVLCALLLGRARIAALEAMASRRLGVPARGVVCADAGMGTDVDKPDDLTLARAVLGGRS